MPHGEIQSEMQQLVKEMRLRGMVHRRDLGILKSQMNKMIKTMQDQSGNEKKTPLQPSRANVGGKSERRECSIEEEPLKWPEAYNHKDRTKWAITHGILQYIYRRDVDKQNILQLSDFLIQLFSHAVTGTAIDMITGQFQSMLANGMEWDALGLLHAMDNTYRNRNEEQLAAALLHACQQFRDENLLSYLPRFQQLLSQNPSSKGNEKCKIYQLQNSLSKMARNYMIGSLRPRTLQELIDYLSILGTEINKVGMEITRESLPGQTGYSENVTQGVAGGKLLGEISQEIIYNLPARATLYSEVVDIDTRNTSSEKVRTKWVSHVELIGHRM